MTTRGLVQGFVLFFVFMLAACGGGSGSFPTTPTPPPSSDPGVFPPGPPPNIPPGTEKTSVAGGYFTIKDVTLDPGPGSELKVLPNGDPRTWRVRYTICIAEKIPPDPWGWGYGSAISPRSESGVRYVSDLFVGGSGNSPLKAGECRDIELEALIHGGSTIPPVIEKIGFGVFVGKGAKGTLRGLNGSEELILADANYVAASNK